MNAEIQHTDVGAYALGLLEEADRRAFDVHLARCDACAAELAVMRGLAGNLDDFRPESAEDLPVFATTTTGAGDEQPAVHDLLRQRARRDRARRRSRVLFGAAAGIVLAAGGAAIGAAVATAAGEPGSPAPPAVARGTDVDAAGGERGGGIAPATVSDGTRQLLDTGELHEATDPGSGAHGTVATEGKRWGTRVALELSKVSGPRSCELVAVDRDGEAHVVTGWAVPDDGYGVPGSPEPLTVQGGVALPPDRIERFEVRLAGGGTLLTVPA